MRKILLSFLVLFFALSAAAIHSSEHEEMKLEGEIEQGDRNFYPDQRIVEFPAVRGGEDVVKYENASYSEYVQWQVKEDGLTRIRKRMKSNLSLNGIRTGSTAEGVEITFVENDEIERNYSFDQLERTVPEQVKGEYTVGDSKVNVTVPVNLTRSEKTLADNLDYSKADAARGSSGFSTSSGESFNSTFRIVDVIKGKHTGDRVENVSVGVRSVNITGYVEVPTPCHKLEKEYEMKESELVLNLDTYATNKLCVQTVAMKKYSLELESKDDFRLEVRHNEGEVRTVETENYSNEPAGLVARIVNLFQDLI